jgi:hypothetical protein
MFSNKNRILGSFLLLSILMVLVIILQDDVSATPEPDIKCLIIVSGSEGYSPHELGKASSFYRYMEERCSPQDIVYLTDSSQQGSDGIANVTNVQNAFEWLSQTSTTETNVTIYVSDHAQSIFNETYLAFDDGNISASTIDVWLGQISCYEMTIVLNGDRSGLAGPDLADPSRDVICSMRANQTGDPDDIFNITRSLEDPTADLDSNGIVDYIEAYWNEVNILTGSGQDPQLYS